jgi:type VII secretion protein EccB
VSGDDRREFASRTPVNENTDRVVYRRGFVTRHQVSGWRFVMRRIASGVALHDTRMLVDPLRTQSRAVLVGALVLITGLAGCFIFSLIRPSGVAGNDVVLADRSTAALYVKVGDQLHPVLNLASARLIAGRPDNPTTVKSSELDKFARGNLLGIPGAPERLVQNTSRDAQWTLCADANPGVTVIAGPLGTGGERAGALQPHHAVLVTNEGRTWLLWDGRRSAVDLADRAVTDALGLGSDIPAPRPIAVGLFNAIPEGPALTAPALVGAGEPPQFPLSLAAPVGAVVAAYEADNTIRYYAVLRDGLQPVPEVLAGILRNTNSYGLEQPPRLGADAVARMPAARGIDVDAYPSQKVTLVDASDDPVTCAQWAKPEGATTNSLTLLSGATLPLPDGLDTVALVGSPNRVALSPGTGYFVGSNAALFWVSDTGVRYGIEDAKAAAALGLTAAPLPIPWSILSQFAAGPTLSQADALLAHDALPPDPNPAGRQNP